MNENGLLFVASCRTSTNNKPRTTTKAMLKNYIKIAFRHLSRNKGFSFINIVGLVAALGVFLVITLFIRHETAYNRFFSDADRIYRIILVNEEPQQTSYSALLPQPIAGELLDQYPEVERMVRTRSSAEETLLSAGNVSVYSSGVLYASSDFFSIFDFPFVAGDPVTAIEESNTAVITYSMAMNLFGNIDVIGEAIRLNNTEDVTITGIVYDPPTNSTIQFDLLQHFPDIQIPLWNMRIGEGYLKLAGTDAAATLAKKLPDYVENNVQLPEGAFADYRIILQPVTEIHLYPESREAESSRIIYIRILFVVAVLILLVACINYINLATAKSAERAREVGVRKTIGATRRQIMVQITTESFIICSLAFALAFLFTEAMIPYIHHFFDINLEPLLSFSLIWIGIVLTTLLAVGIISGAYAALYLSSFKPAEVLKGSGLNTGRFSGNLRKGLVVAQFAISMVIVLATLLISQQMDFIQTERLNGNDAQVVAVRSNSPAVNDQFESFKQELLKHPDIEVVSGGTIPNTIGMSSGYQDSLGRFIRVHIFTVEFDYLETLGLELVAGRDLDPERSEDHTVSAIINESAARAFGIDESFEKDIEIPFGNSEPIGIVKDFHTLTLFDPIDPVMIQIRNPDMSRRTTILVRLREGGIASGLDHLHKTWAQFETAFPVSYNFLDELLDRDYRAELRMAKIFGSFSGFSIFIACLGLFGLSAFTARRRTKEIGIRKVMGATVGGIVTLLSKDFLKLVFIGFVIAIPIAWVAMNRWLEDFAYRIEIGPGVFLLAGLVAVVIALATVSFQSIKAALMNPVESLRSE